MGDIEPSKQKSGPDPSHVHSWITKIKNATSRTTTPVETSAKQGIQKIQKIPSMLRDTKDYDKYFAPHAVSLGPYHHGCEKFKFIQDLKPFITNLLTRDAGKLEDLFAIFQSKIEEVRNFYVENSTNTFSDDELTCMMVEDGYFILYFMDNTCIEEDELNELGLKSHHIAIIQQDLFLLENQVPCMVLQTLMSFVGGEQLWLPMIKWFVRNVSFLASGRVQKGWCNMNTFSCFCGGSSYQHSHVIRQSMNRPVHLLELLHERVVGKQKPSQIRKSDTSDRRYTFHNVRELQDVGITFTPSKTSCMADIQFKSCGFSAYLELPAIAVDDSMGRMLLNMVAYEMCSDVPKSWVTSYICFLDSLISNAEDVKELRKAGILYNSHVSDEEVAKLLKEISYKLVPNPVMYADAKFKIQKHCDQSRRAKTWATQFKQEYFKSPWSALALVGAIVALFLGGVQAYFSVWPAPGECDALCKYLKQNHHL